MVSFFKRIFRIEKKINCNEDNSNPIVKVYIDGKEATNNYSIKILRKPNLIEHIKLPSFNKEFDRNIKIQDNQDLRRKYNVNLYNMECNCPAFIEKYKIYSSDDLRRICQHLKDAIDQNLGKKDPFLARVIRRYYNKANDVFYYAHFNEKFVIHFHESYYWINVIAEHDTEIKYAYNIIQKRWSTAGIPEKSMDLIKEISSIVVLE